MFCCLNDGDGGGDEGALMAPLWVSCPDEEDERSDEEVKGICSYREKALEALLSPWQELKPAACASLHFLPSPPL